MTAPAASEAVRKALRGYSPTPEQWRAISHPLEPLHLIAGAGSGKTAIMAARIAWIIENKDYSPSQILGLTFTNKAADELEERVRGAVEVMGGHRAEELTVQTYHAFAAGIVRDHGLLVGVESDAALMSEAQQWQLVMTCIDDLPAFEAIELRSSAGLVRATLSLASALSDHIVGSADVEAAADRILSSPEVKDEDIREAARKRKELCLAVDAYRRAKQERQRIDFGDQVTKAVEILEGSPEARRQYRERFPVLLLDEYQDTNVAQRRLIQALVARGGAITAVGDTRQAIYSFRGATMYNLIGFPEHFPRPGTGGYEPISLSENFRSGSDILGAANAIVEGIAAARRPGAPLRPDPGNGRGKVLLGLFGDEHEEAEWIAAECERLHGAPTADGRDPVEWKDIAILVRRKASMDAVFQALEEAEIPVEVVGLGGLLKTPEVTEIVAWLRCLETKPAANRWLARVLMGPRWRIHYRELALCARWAADQNQDLKLRLAGGDKERARDMEPGEVGFSLGESLDHVEEIDGLPDDARSRLAAFARRLSDLRKKSGAPLLELVQEVIAGTGMLDALGASSARTAPAARQNVANFLDHVAAFAPVEGEATLRSFIAYLDAADDAEETLEATQPAEQDSVKLMTVHAAKGLEFECVFVPSVAASKNKSGAHIYSIFPNEKAPNPLTSYTELPYEVREDASHLPRWTGKLATFKADVKERVREDERRLFYVALTRAKQRLAVTAAHWYGRDKSAKGPSLFWEELEPLAEQGLLTVFTKAEPPAENPLFSALEGRRAWPPEPRSAPSDELFPEGWGRVGDALSSGEVGFEDLVARAGPGAAAELGPLMAAAADELDLLASARRPPPPAPDVPQVVSATDFVRLESGDIEPIELIRRLPEGQTSSRRLGTEIHRLIEERSREAPWGSWSASSYPEESELDEPSGVEDADAIEGLLNRWEQLGYAERKLARLPSGEPMVELPFLLRWNGRIIRGRIDAVYETGDGGLEIVDFKTGKRFVPPALDQLEIYARALDALGLVGESPVTLTYAFLDGDKPLARAWTRG